MEGGWGALPAAFLCALATSCPSHPALCRGPRPGPSLPSQTGLFLRGPIPGEAQPGAAGEMPASAALGASSIGQDRADAPTRAAPRRGTVALSGQFPEFTAFSTSLGSKRSSSLPCDPPPCPQPPVSPHGLPQSIGSAGFPPGPQGLCWSPKPCWHRRVHVHVLHQPGGQAPSDPTAPQTRAPGPSRGPGSGFIFGTFPADGHFKPSQTLRLGCHTRPHTKELSPRHDT